MRTAPYLTLAGLFATLHGGPAANAQGGYLLETGSELTVLNCLPPCTCPPTQITGPLSGQFTLAFDHEDASFRYYNVLAVAWIANLNGTLTPVVGSGTYALSAPIGFLHQMQLDLAVGPDIPRHFDSGLVSADVHHLFPWIGVALSSVEFDCNRYDLHLIAAPGTPTPCYANCDGSTAAPVLNINDFICFLNTFAAGDSYANCDHSTVPPVLNIQDFTCFLNAFAAGCS